MGNIIQRIVDGVAAFVAENGQHPTHCALPPDDVAELTAWQHENHMIPPDVTGDDGIQRSTSTIRGINLVRGDEFKFWREDAGDGASQEEPTA